MTPVSPHPAPVEGGEGSLGESAAKVGWEEKPEDSKAEAQVVVEMVLVGRVVVGEVVLVVAGQEGSAVRVVDASMLTVKS